MMFVSVLSVFAMQVIAVGLRIGLASTSPAGQICVALPGPRVASGAVVTIVETDSPQSAFETIIERAVPSCEVLERALISGPFYLAPRPKGIASGPRGPLVAFVGRVSSRDAGSGRLALRLSERDSNAQVRSCTSLEGVHLTVWAGEPLKSRQLWHAYYYLGYDVEPSCQDADAPR
jgi:hypothetical protein